MESCPVMRPRIPTAEQVFGYLQGMDARQVYTNCGPLASELESRYAERFGVDADRVVACANATLALQGAMFVSPAGRFHCPAWTFPATPLAVVNSGKELAFADVRLDDWMIEAPEPTFGDGLVPVLPYGAELCFESWRDWDEVVVDAAASGGAAHRDLSALPAGWAVVISLHATKVLGAGEGGIAIFGDPERAHRFRSFTVLGFDGSRESGFTGTNAKMSEVVAAYGLAALDAWEVEEAEWRAARELVSRVEDDLGIGSICSAYPGVNPYWIVRLDSAADARAATEALGRAGIGTRLWWPLPCTRMGSFVHEWGSMSTPNADLLSATAIGLPFFRGMTGDDVRNVANVMSTTLNLAR